MTSEKSNKTVKVIQKRVFDIFTLELRDDGILHIHLSNEKEYTLVGIKEVNLLIGEMVNYTPLPVLMSADDFVVFPEGAREMNAKKNTFPYSKAVAYLAKTPAHQLIVSFYINNNKPERPTKMFETEEDALKWLKTFL